MSVIAVTGLQWGDEGKGKLVDLLGEFAGVTARFQGGSNAGHTVVLGDRRVVLHHLPSGAMRRHVRCVLGQGMVIDPSTLIEEMHTVESINGPFVPNRLTISRRAHVILPIHRQADALGERTTGVRIGTTLRGIGPAYEDKAGRRGLRMLDLTGDPGRLRAWIEAIHDAWAPRFERHGLEMPGAAGAFDMCTEWGKALGPYIGDASLVLHEEIVKGTNVLLEGAQGTLLDIDHGTYPFVTSSNASALGAPAGAGIAPSCITSVLGITKAYTTRVGEGPFPTEEKGEAGDRLRDAGHEVGSTTGRPRRCGWLDVAALRYAVRLNGVTSIALTKLDVLTGLHEIKVSTGYRLRGRVLSEIPLDDLDAAEPVYETVEGWGEDISGARDLRDLPAKARRYIARLEGWLGVPASLVSVGPERGQTVIVKNPFRE